MKHFEDKPRNFVKKFADEFTKPSRHRDRKHDYARNQKHRHRSPEGAEVPHHGSPRKYAEQLRESEDWFGDSDLNGETDYWLEPEEDPSSTG